MDEKKAKGAGFMLRLAGFIVDKRNLIFLIVIISLVFSAFSSSWVDVENDLVYYLPDDSTTKAAVNLMAEEFTTFGTAKIMIANISAEEAQTVADEISAIKGVQTVEFDDSADHYNRGAALFSVTFAYDENNTACLESLDYVKELLSVYDVYVSTDLGDQTSEIIKTEVNKIMVIVAIVVVAVLIFTSTTYAEVPVLLLTFVVAAILNKGTSFLLGKISFVSNSVTTVLQLALSLDYAVILCNRYKEEHETLEVREAVIVSLSKAIPEIGASSLTTVGGLIAMMFMQFNLGPDMAVNLIKAIVFALLAVFTVMPGLLVLFGPLMDKTRHKVFVPKIPIVGRLDYATRFVIPPIFVVLVLLGIHFSNECPYVYGYDTLTTPELNDVQIADNMIKEYFGSSNMVALVVPAGDYKKEAAMLAELDACDEVDYSTGLSNVEALGGYMLTDTLTPRQFSELANMDYETAELVYAAYAIENGTYEKLIGGLSSYNVPLIDIFLFVCEQVNSGYVTLDADQTEMLDSAYLQMHNAKLQLQSDRFSRMLIYLNLPVGGEKTYSFIDTIYSIAEKYYPDGNVYVAGNSTNEYEFRNSFERDNVVVSVVSILIVLVVLLFTFKSAGMPLLLILVIQGSIWINFSFPTLTDSGVFFMSYLVVSSIQMGANIDYAIVIASRYNEIKNEMSHKEAIIETLNFAFPTIVTSGTILATAGILIGQMTSEAAIVGIGQALGRGTILSLVLVMFVLPQILLVGSAIVDKTSFSMKTNLTGLQHKASGRVVIEGNVHGEIHGIVNGYIRATVDGDVDLRVHNGKVEPEASSDLPLLSEPAAGEDGAPGVPDEAAVPAAGDSAAAAEAGLSGDAEASESVETSDEQEDLLK